MSAGPTSRHVNPTHFEPSFLKLNGIPDMAGNICQAMLHGDGVAVLPVHLQHPHSNPQHARWDQGRALQ